VRDEGCREGVKCGGWGLLSCRGLWTKRPLFLPPPAHLDDCTKFHLHDPTRLRTRLFTPQGPFSQAVLDIFTSRFTSAQSFNFTRGLCLHKDYVAGREFVAWKGGYCCGWGGEEVTPFLLVPHWGQCWLWPGAFGD
jgi:hypothetical protein